MYSVDNLLCILAPRSAIAQDGSRSSTPSFLKETKAWKNRHLKPEEQIDTSSPVQSSIGTSGVTISPPVKSGSSMRYANSTVSSSSMDEKMAARIREVKQMSSGGGTRETSAVVKSRAATPTGASGAQKQRPASAGPRARPSAPVDPSAKPVHSRLFQAQAEIEKKKQAARARKEELERKELTFKPTLYSTPPSNLHVKGKVITQSPKDHLSPRTPETATESATSSASKRAGNNVVRTLRGSGSAPGSDKRFSNKGLSSSVNTKQEDGANSSEKSDVFDRLSKLTTASLLADNCSAPPPAPVFSGGSIVPEDHPSLSSLTSHPSFGVSGEE